MVEHRDLAAWCDAVADKQTETVGQQPVALHPQVVVTAQPDQPRSMRSETGDHIPGYTGNTAIPRDDRPAPRSSADGTMSSYCVVTRHRKRDHRRNAGGEWPASRGRFAPGAFCRSAASLLSRRDRVVTVGTDVDRAADARRETRLVTPQARSGTRPQGHQSGRAVEPITFGRRTPVTRRDRGLGRDRARRSRSYRHASLLRSQWAPTTTALDRSWTKPVPRRCQSRAVPLTYVPCRCGPPGGANRER